ncbi:MAG: HAD-like domain-containing protein [Piptocephalis tieghemiana]|nr:MAG: HAD-like domain-containing protein [Piptocephalis tieghemiana]
MSKVTPTSSPPRSTHPLNPRVPQEITRVCAVWTTQSLPPLQTHYKILDKIRDKEAFICDMDGVIYHGSKLLPGVKEFIAWLKKENKKFLFLTNNSAPTPRELRDKMLRLGVDVPEEHFYTSGMATAKYLLSQRPEGGTCYVVGEPGLVYALYESNFTMNDQDPDYVIIGEGKTYNFDNLSKACICVNKGARLIGTNPDVNGPGEGGVIIPACASFVSTVEKATGRQAFYCGKPSSIMMRYAQRLLQTNRRDVCIIGDRMDTDILAGINSEMDSVLVLSGVSFMDNFSHLPYQPTLVLEGVFQIPPEEDKEKLVESQ